MSSLINTLILMLNKCWSSAISRSQALSWRLKICRRTDNWRLRCTKPHLLNEQTSHLLAALHAEGIEALAAQLQQLVALGVARLYCCAEAFGYAAHQALGALVVAADAVPVSTLDTVR